jgi:hypothetical protein
MRHAIPSLLVAAALASCGFPDVTYSTAPASDGSSPTIDASTDVSSSGGNEAGDAPSDAPANADGAGDANDAAGEDAPDGAPDAATCDEDHDTYQAQGAICGGLDCDDHDPRANPGVMSFQTYAPQAPTNGDWNCDGVVEKQYSTNVSCNMLMLGPACVTFTGFTGDPACGSSGAFVQCTASTLGLTCTDGPTSMQVQGCK